MSKLEKRPFIEFETRTSDNIMYTKVYQLWYNMKSRCLKTSNPYYNNYGGRGVTICEEWLVFNNFAKDVDSIKGFDYQLFLDGKLYLDKDGFSLDNYVYCLEKCQFVSLEESNKMKPNQQNMFKATSPSGKEFYSYNQSDFAKENGLRQSSISGCLRGLYKTHKGWFFEYVNEGRSND